MNNVNKLSSWRNSKSRKRLGKVFALLLVLTMQTVYIKLDGLHLDVVFNILLVLVGIWIIMGDGRVLVTRSLTLHLCAALGLFLTIPLCHILFLSVPNINFTALVMVSALCIILFSISVIYINEIGIRHFLQDIADVSFYIIAISFVMYLIGQVSHILKPIGTVSINWGGPQVINNYYWILFTAQGSSYHSFANGRFTSIFTEAPMCAFIICLTLLITLFISHKKKSFRVIILSIAGYTTVSTMAWIIAILSISVFVLFQKPKSRLLRYLRYLPIIIVIIIIPTVIVTLYKLKMVSDVSSVSIRSANFSGALRDFIQSPIFGFGFKSDAIGVTGGNTSVFSNVLQQGGILFGIWYFVPMIIALILLIHHGKWSITSAFLLYTAMLYATVVTYTALSVSIVAVCFVYSFASQHKVSLSVNAIHPTAYVQNSFQVNS